MNFDVGLQGEIEHIFQSMNADIPYTTRAATSDPADDLLRLVQVEAYVRTYVLHQRGVLQLAFRLQYTHSLHVSVVIAQCTYAAMYGFEYEWQCST